MANDDDDLPAIGPSTSLLAGGVGAGVVPFVFSMQTTESVNGKVTSFIDYVAVGGGAIALIIGVIGLVGALKVRDETRMKLLGLAGGSLALGCLQLARGFGAFV